MGKTSSPWRWQRRWYWGPAAPAGWQEITALSFRRNHPTGHQSRREPAPAISPAACPRLSALCLPLKHISLIHNV